MSVLLIRLLLGLVGSSDLLIPGYSAFTGCSSLLEELDAIFTANRTRSNDVARRYG